MTTSFSVFFFAKIDEAKLRGRLEKIEVPQDFTKIHKPVFEKNFFFNYLFIIIIFALLASVGIFVLNNSVREQIFILSQKFLSNKGAGNSNEIRFFIEEQFSVADIAVYFFSLFHVATYCLLGVHLYGKVSSPAFAIFATMRSFLKGNYHSRVHLIGHYYLREDCRKINKYLDHIEKSLTGSKQSPLKD
jgi:p-aminobenzoyl-glutamate transporter AbgT